MPALTAYTYTIPPLFHSFTCFDAVLLPAVVRTMGRSLLLLRLLLLASTAAGRVDSLPASFVLLPLSSFTNASLIAPYNCDPIFTFHSCNSRGDCHLLLDSHADYAGPFLNASTAEPTPACETTLETKNIDIHTPLPAAVCLCQAGYTGRGDYINHYAMDGDSCGINTPAVVALCSVSIVEFIVVLLLALHRLYRWYVWHVASIADSASLALTLSVDTDSFQSSEDNNNTNHTTNNSNVDASNDGNQHVPTPVSQHVPSTSHPVDAILLAPTPLVRAPSLPPLVGPPTTPLRATRGHHRTATIGGGPVRVHGRSYGDATGSGMIKTRSQKQQLLYRHLTHITFLHPMLSVAVAVISIVYFSIRVGTDWTLGSSYTMSCLIYAQSLPFLWACSVAVLNTLRAASAITRTQTGVKGLSNVNQWAKRSLIGLCTYATLVGLLVFLVRADSSQQQLMAQLNLCLCYTPISILGLVSVVATRRITQSLVQHLDLLSAKQQQERLDTCRKLRRQSNVLAFLLVGNTVLSVTLALQTQIRQVGVPYFALLTHTSTAVILTIRLLMLRPQQPKQSIAPAPATGILTSPTQVNRLLAASEAATDSRGNARSLRAAGGSGAGDGSEVDLMVRSPSKWGRTMSAKSGGGVGRLVSTEQPSLTRASSDSVRV